MIYLDAQTLTGIFLLISTDLLFSIAKKVSLNIFIIAKNMKI